MHTPNGWKFLLYHHLPPETPWFACAVFPQHRLPESIATENFSQYGAAAFDNCKK